MRERDLVCERLDAARPTSGESRPRSSARVGNRIAIDLGPMRARVADEAIALDAARAQARVGEAQEALDQLVAVPERVGARGTI